MTDELKGSKVLVGRGQALLARFADDLSRAWGGPPLAKARAARLNRHRVSKLYKSFNGGSWEVSLVDDDGRETGYIAKVTVSYSRFDDEAANRKERSHA